MNHGGKREVVILLCRPSERRLPASPARETAYRILCRVESSGAFAVDLLHRPEVSKLEERDRGLVTELVMGVLRWRGELDFRIEQLSGKPLEYFDTEVATILRLGIFQIRFLEKVPKSAVVNESVELAKTARKRSAAGLVNAVLRKCDAPARGRNGRPSSDYAAETTEAAVRSLPQWLSERWARQYGLDGMQRLACASVRTPPTTLRVSEAEREAVRQELAREGIRAAPGKYSPQALLVEAGNIRYSKLWREGCVAVQDEASQLVGLLVCPALGGRVLDLCAAPGMKTAQIAEGFSGGAIIACDRSQRRLGAMVKLLPHPAGPGVSVRLVCLDAERRLPFSATFERVLLDAPCSGTGTLARNPEIKLRLEPKDLVRLAEAQAHMLQNALDVLAPGGRLVYATCSLEAEENEDVVERVLGGKRKFRSLTCEELAREFPALSSLFDSQGYLRTRPALDSMDGFFAAVIIRVQG